MYLLRVYRKLRTFGIPLVCTAPLSFYTLLKFCLCVIFWLCAQQRWLRHPSMTMRQKKELLINILVDLNQVTLSKQVNDILLGVNLHVFTNTCTCMYYIHYMCMYMPTTTYFNLYFLFHTYHIEKSFNFHYDVFFLNVAVAIRPAKT